MKQNDTLLVYHNGKWLRRLVVPFIYEIPESVRQKYIERGFYLCKKRPGG